MASHYVELVCASAPTEGVHTEERTEMQKYNRKCCARQLSN